MLPMVVIASKFAAGFLLFFVGFAFLRVGGSLFSTLGGAAMMLLGAVVVVWAVFARARGKAADDWTGPGEPNE